MDQDYFETLPTDITNILLSIFDDRSKRMLRSTSTKWFNLINYDDFTIYFAKPSMLPELIQTFSRYSKPIGLRFEKVLSHDNNYTMLASLTNLTRLDYDPKKTTEGLINFDLQHFSTLTKLQHFDCGPFILPHMQHFTNLTNLVIPATSAGNCRIHLDKLQQLTKLEKIQFNVPRSFARKPINFITKFGNLSALKTIDIRDFDGSIVFDEESVMKMSKVSKVSIACYDAFFPFSKLPNLESLRISSDRFDDFSTCTKLTSLSIEGRPTLKSATKILASDHDYQQLSALHKLKSLTIESKLCLNYLKEDQQLHFLSKMTGLESFSICQRESIGLTGQYLEVINSSKLTKISIPALAEAKFISHLTSLQVIQISRMPLEPDYSFQLQNVTCLIGFDLLTAPTYLFPNLKRFCVPFGPKIFGIGGVSKLTPLSQLESLSLDFIDDKALRMIAYRTKLTELHLRFDSKEKYNFGVLNRMTNLKKLSLGLFGECTDIDTTTLWQAISNMTNLEILSMFQIGEESVGPLLNLPKLKQLRITGKSVANFNEVRLSGMTNLQVLRLTSELLSDSPARQNDNFKSRVQLPYLYDYAKL